jgi:hypothetical protein
LLKNKIKQKPRTSMITTRGNICWDGDEITAAETAFME